MILKTLLLSLLFALKAGASLPPECMGARSGSWFSLALEVKMGKGSCQSVIELEEGLYLLRYELRSGPLENDGRTTCQWGWVPSGGSYLAPAGDAPESVVCSVNH